MRKKVTESCKTLRTLGRQSLTGHWKEAIILCLICRLLMDGPAFCYSFLPEMLQSQFLAILIDIYFLFIGGPITLATAGYFLRIFRQQHNPGIGASIGFGFVKGHITKAISIYIRMLVITALWSMLFVIPGIIAGIGYSQAFFILADDPRKTPAQCMRESNTLMYGNRIKYLLLYLSFIGWNILASLPSWSLHAILDAKTLDTALEYLMSGDTITAIYLAQQVSPIIFVCQLLGVIVSAYISASEAAFFDILTGKLVVKEVSTIKSDMPFPITDYLGFTEKETKLTVAAERLVDNIKDSIKSDKQDTADTKTDELTEIEDVKSLAEAEIQEVKAKTEAEIEDVKAEIDAEIEFQETIGITDDFITDDYNPLTKTDYTVVDNNPANLNFGSGIQNNDKKDE